MKERIVTVYMAIFISLLFSFDVFAGDILVSTPVTSKKINSAIASASPGDVVIIPDGTYYRFNQIVVPRDVDGTEANPITLKAATAGGVTFTGNSASPLIFVQGDWWIIRDFKFIDVSEVGNANTHGINTRYATGTRVTNNYFEGFGVLTDTNKNSWPVWIGHFGKGNYSRVDHNTFIENEAMGVVISSTASHCQVDHNYFKDTLKDGSNGFSAIHVGGSDKIDLYTTVEYNVFENMSADPETISNKSSSNTYQRNVFKSTGGATAYGLVLRGGDDCIVDGNYFFDVDKQNIRVHGTGHKIINNYFENPGYSAIILAEGDNGATYANVSDILIANNTIVKSPVRGIYIGWWPNCYVKPKNLTFKNNIIQSSTGDLITNKGYTGTFNWTTNLHYATGTATYWRNGGGGNEPGSGITHANPNLQKGQYIYRLQASSTNAINKGVRDINVTTDIDKNLRDASLDIGCDEFSGTIGRPISESEVGVSWLRQGTLKPPAPTSLKVVIY
ncbi:MAG: polysaccharide lyase 6 family protein [Deltaproteobacteria bacterium]|jgi:poly(beta-D-mannuronate) lyase|nr:polysaccharide lyase 6 family protein [Deltaproteobacteria bacterium]